MSAFIVKLLNGLMLPCVTRLIPSGEKVGVFGGSPAPGDAASGCKGGDLIRIGSMLAGINVSKAALGWLFGVCGGSPDDAGGDNEALPDGV